MSTVTDRDHGWDSGGGPVASPANRWWRLMATDAPRATVLIRVVVGGIFVSEGIQKFLDPEQRGPGRFAADTPLPAPGFFAYLTGSVEIVCGVLLVIGLLTRLAAIPMIVTMVGAEVFTKVPILVSDGFLTYAHEARAELSQLFGAAFLLVVGAGAWSLDARITGPVAAPEPRGQRPGGRAPRAADATAERSKPDTSGAKGAAGAAPARRLDGPTWPE